MKKVTIEEYINRATLKHAGIYSYNLWTEKIHSHAKVPIVCSKHGVFYQRLSTHLDGGGCNQCSIERRAAEQIKTPEQHIKEFRKVHGNQYRYQPKTIIHTLKKIPIECEKHGIFYQQPSIHKRGSGCPKCAKQSQKDKVRLTSVQAIERARKVHGDRYDYKNVLTQYTAMNCPVDITCKEHGIFTTTMGNHISCKTHCPKCSSIKGNAKKRTPISTRIERMKEAHGGRYEYPNLIDDTNVHDKIKIICPVHGEFKQQMQVHLQGWGCSKCSVATSKGEDALFESIKHVDNNLHRNDRITIAPKELDLISLDHKIAIEYCGIYWHSERFKPKRYHLEKLEEANKQGYRLITIFEHEWIYKPEHVISRINSTFNIIANKIYARKCKVVEILSEQSNEFIEQNHIQGKRPTYYNYGLIYNEEIVAVMTFSKQHEIIRFCNLLHTSVIGGADKLLKYHIRATNPSSITSFADRRWSDGNLYKKLGFTFQRNTPVNYWYFKGSNIKLMARQNFQKHKLVKKLDNFNPNLSEWENMKLNGYDRIWDCGSSKWKLEI